MSEHTAHVAIFEDTYRMIQNSKRFCPEFKISLEKEYETAVIASESKTGDMFIIPFIKQAREVFQKGNVTSESRQILAAALGWTAHKSADKQVKPLAREHNYDAQRFKDAYPVWNEKNEAMQDVIIFQRVYGETSQNAISRYFNFGKYLYQKKMESIPAAQKIDLDKVEHLMASMWKADFLSLQQISEPKEYDDKWLKELFDRTQTFNEKWNYYIEAYQNPDIELKKYLIEEKNFYNPKDKIIQWVRNIQLELPDSSFDEERAVEEASKDSASQYAKILLNAYQYLSAANDFFKYQIDEDAFMKAWDAVA